MIRPLRRRHLLFAVLMLLSLPLLVVFSFFKHRSNGVVENQIENLLNAEIEDFPLVVWNKPHLWTNLPELETQLLASVDIEARLAIRLSSVGSVHHPDILIYWSPRAYTTRSGISENMHLLGVYQNDLNPILELPDEIKDKDGFLIMYSLAMDEFVSEAPLNIPRNM